MSEYGIGETGFTRKTLSIIRTEINDELKSNFGSQINLSVESIFGQLRDIFAERLALLWELAEEVYNSQYPETAENTSLENVGSLSALEKIEAAPSNIVDQRFLGVSTTVIPSGTQVAVDGDETTVFETDEELTLVSGTDEVQTIEFDAVPDEGGFTVSYINDETATIAYTDNAAAFQIALRALTYLSEVEVSGTFTAGFVVTFTGIDGKQEQPILIEETNTLKESSAEVTITITKTIPGVNQGVVDMTCTETGPTSVNARTLTSIVNPISGVNSTINVSDATIGRNIETNAEFRSRRRTRLVTSLAGPTEAIMNKLWHLNDDEYSDLDQLQNVNVYENITNVIDSRNLPPKSLMAVVRQTGDVITRDQEIAQSIFESKPAGIETSFGTDIHTIDFTGTPSNGGSWWTLTYSGQTTAHLDYDASNTDVQTALNTLSNLSGVVVTGTMGDGFEVEYSGDNISRVMELLTGDISSLNGVTAITIARHSMKIVKTVTDSVGVAHTINFARPIEVEIEVEITDLETNANYPVDGDTQIKTAIAAWGNSLGVGVDVILVPTLIAQIASIPGITDFVYEIRKVGGSFAADNIIISDGTSTHPEFSSWDTSNISVTI